MDQGTPDHPGVIAPPPALFAGAFVLSLVVGRVLPLIVPIKGAVRLVGALLVVASLTLAGWGFTEMRRAGTNVDPREPATTIVESGPFRLSRNPLYLSLTGMYLGLALLFNRIAALVLLPLTLFVLTKGVIEREERYLDTKFGDQYREYRGRVRRWL